MPVAHLVTHPEVVIDPSIPVPETNSRWALGDTTPFCVGFGAVCRIARDPLQALRDGPAWSGVSQRD